MVADQQALLEDQDRVEELLCSYDGEARLNGSFIVLMIGASLIAIFGVLANNEAVVIGAMVVAPWVLGTAAAGDGFRCSNRASQAAFTITDHPCCWCRNNLDPVDGIGLDRSQPRLAFGGGLIGTGNRPDCNPIFSI